MDDKLIYIHDNNKSNLDLVEFNPKAQYFDVFYFFSPTRPYPYEASNSAWPF